MADPKIKIKRGIGKPSNWNGVIGATAGELYVDFTNTSFYIGNTFGEAITFGNLIDPDPNLTANSDKRIATQKAVKTYAQANLSSSSSETDLFMIRQISYGETVGLNTIITDEESSNNAGRGPAGSQTEFDNRWTSYYFNINQENLPYDAPNIVKTKSNSIFKLGQEFPSTIVNDSAKIIQTSGSTIKAFVSYQISFDTATNSAGATYGGISNWDGTTRRAAIKVSTYSGGNLVERYHLPSYITLKTNGTPSYNFGGTNLHVISASGIIDFPNWIDDNQTTGTGFIELVWGSSGTQVALVSPPFNGNYVYAGRSTTNVIAPGHFNETFASISNGYATRLSVIRI